MVLHLQILRRFRGEIHQSVLRTAGLVCRSRDVGAEDDMRESVLPI